MKKLIIVFTNQESSWIQLPLRAVSSYKDLKHVNVELQLQNYGPDVQKWSLFIPSK